MVMPTMAMPIITLENGAWWAISAMMSMLEILATNTLWLFPGESTEP